MSSHHIKTHNIARTFDSSRFYVLDGGFTSTLAEGGDWSDHPLWSSVLLHRDSETVVKVHHSFIKAGADIITTNTYQSSVEMFREHLNKLNDRILDPIHMYQKAVSLAEEVWYFLLHASSKSFSTLSAFVLNFRLM